MLLFGRESSGVPDEVHAAADARLMIPMRAGLRSLNVAMACAMVVGEALRQMRLAFDGSSFLDHSKSSSMSLSDTVITPLAPSIETWPKNCMP